VGGGLAVGRALSEDQHDLELLRGQLVACVVDAAAGGPGSGAEALESSQRCAEMDARASTRWPPRRKRAPKQFRPPAIERWRSLRLKFERVMEERSASTSSSASRPRSRRAAAAAVRCPD